MPRKPLPLEAYQALAAECDLTFMEADSPQSARTACRWRCNRCHRLLEKSYNAVKYNPNPCRCRVTTLQAEDYHALAATLYLRWCGEILPENVHSLTIWWSGKRKVYFEAAYEHLAYGKIPEDLQEFVEETDRVSL